MATDASVEDMNCIEVHSLKAGLNLPEPSFRNELMESVPEEGDAMGESNMTDSDKSQYSKKNQRKDSYEAKLQDKDKEITRLRQQLEGKMAITQSREARGVKEETDCDKNEDDEEEQYKFLLEAEALDSVSPSKFQDMESVSQPVSNQSSAPSHAILEKRLSETQEELQKKLHDTSKLQRMLSETEQELDKQRRNSTTLERKLSDTQDELEDKRRENDKLREEARTRRSSSARNRSAMDEKLHIKLNQEIGKGKELEKKLQFEQEQVENYKKQVDEMHQQLSKMRCDKDAKTEEQVQQYEREKAEFEERMQRLQDSLENKSHDLAEEAKKCQKYQEDLQQKQREIESQTHQLRNLEQSLSVEKEEKTKIHSQVQALLDQNEVYKTRVLDLQQEKEKVEKEAQDVCTKFQQEAEKTLLTYDQLKEKSDKDSKELLDKRQKVTSYMTKIESLRAENSELETANKKMANDVQRLTAEKKKMANDVDRFKAEKEKLESNIKTVQDAILAVKLSAEENESAFHVEREARTKDKATHEGKVRQLKMEIEDLNTKLQNMQSKNDALARDKKHLMEQLNAFAATQCHDTFTS